MTSPIDRVSLESLSITDLQKQKLKELFPEVFTEGNKVDFERLKRTLGEMVDAGKERFGMNWAGKADCFKTIQQPSIATLVPARDESVDFDTTENLFIEGDNLEVLKLLQKSYLGKVKMIYIDPPYNTGNDFIYPDNYSENLDTYLEYTGQIDGEGRKFSTNVDTDGRFHSKWMNMMYPRLFLAKNLLREDGVIFISIDDSEINNLKGICNEIFGEENFIAQFIWAAGKKNDSKHVSISHEYVLCFVKNKQFLSENKIIWRQRKKGLEDIYKEYEKLKKIYKSDYKAIEKGMKEWFRLLSNDNPAKRQSHYSSVDSRGLYFPDNISWPGGGGPKYEVLHPITNKPVKVPSRGWLFSSPEKMQEIIKDDRVHFGEDHNSVPCIKSYLSDREEEVPYSVFYQDGRASTKRLRALMGGDYFDHPKDEVVLKELIDFSANKEAIVLDFFAGSATTAHAVMDLNKEDGGNRKFICVQLPEPCDEKSEAFKAGYQTIADISKERIRRAAAKIKAEQTEAQAKADLFDDGTANTVLDLGFRVFKLQKSNFKVWDANTPKDPEAIQQALELHVDHIDPQAEQEAILFELLLKSGFELTTPIQKFTLADKQVYSIAHDILLICLDKALTLDVIKAMAELNPSRVICLDEGFQDNDQLKTNAVLIMKSKGVNDFRTV